MITFLQLNIEGFGSVVEPQTIPLNLGGIIRVSGPNGMGKTTLFSALTWACYGKNLKGISEVGTWKEYQIGDYQGTKVEVTWQSDSDVCKVIRCLNYKGKLDDGIKGGNRLLFYVDGNLSNSKGKLAIQNEINLALGFSYELFLNSIMFGQGMKRLLQESNTDKKKLFEEIFKLDYLNVARTTATNERNYIQGLARDGKSEIDHIKDTIEIEKANFEDVKSQQKHYKSIIKNERVRVENELISIKDSIENLEKKLDGSLEEKHKNLTKQLRRYQTELKHVNNVRNIPLIELVSDVLALLKKASYKKALKKLEEVYEAFKQYSVIQDKISKTNREISEYNSKLRKQDQYQGEIKRLNNQKEKLIKRLKEVKTQTPPSLELDGKFKTKIRKLKEKLNILETKQKELDKNLDDYNWVINDPLSNNGLKAFLFDSCLSQLNHNLERFADTLGFRIEFNIDLDSTRKEFVTLIEKDGVIAEYDELSGGEKALVNLTMCLALHETLTLSKDVNILLLDEVFENLCRDNVELVISLIKEISQSKTIFLISHLENLPFGNCRNLVVSKENGCTYYKGI